MRISTSMMFDTNARNLTRMQGDLYRLQTQMATGRRILTPSDDPVAAAQALVVSQQQSINQQFIDNQGNAAGQLTELEDRLNGINELLQAVKTRVVEAGNGAYSDSDRKSIAADIRERYQELVGLANASDAMGNYVFSGFSAKTQPFSVSGTPGSRTVTYQGDEGRRQLQVEASRIMDVSESGSDIFMRIPQGNGNFMVGADAGNTGTGVIGGSSMISGFDSDTYTLTYDAANTQFTVTSASGTSTIPYVSGSDMLLGPSGQQFKVSISGTPADGDEFTIQPATNQDIFTTLDEMISALESNVSGNPTGRAEFQNTMTRVAQNVEQAMDKVLARQTSIGARRLELDALTSVAGDLDLQYQSDLSKLQDLDYTEAISAMANRQMVLEAAQLTFKQVSQMSLFSYL